jgi:hypothetical protein
MEQIIEYLLGEMRETRELVKAGQEMMEVYQENIEAKVDTTMSTRQEAVDVYQDMVEAIQKRQRLS